jgi:hypothetical protein
LQYRVVPIVTGVFVALVAIALVTTMAFAAIVGSRVQGESMTESSGSVAPFTGVEGVTMMRWSSGATTGATASETFNVAQQVDQVVVQARQPSGASNVMALVIDGTVRGTFTPSTSGFAPATINLSSPLSAGQQHTLVLRPNATLSKRVDVDFFELHNDGTEAPVDTDGDGVPDSEDACPSIPGSASNNGCPEQGDTTPPAAPSITGGPAAGSTDQDGNVTFSWNNAESGGTNECSMVPQGQQPSYTPCTSPRDYNGLANGDWTFSVRQIDAADNVSPAASRNFSVSVATGSCTGTEVNPTGNLENIVDNPGTYCLRAGVYEESDEQVVINADNVTIRNVPGQRAELRGRIRINDGATNFRIESQDVSPDVEGIVLNSTYSPVNFGKSGGGIGHFTSDPHLVRGNGATFSNVEIDGDNDVLGDPWYSNAPAEPSRAIGTCVLIADGTDGVLATDVQILNSDVHNCGAPPNDQAGNPGTHALYLSGGLRVKVYHNQIYENGTRGVQIRNGTDNTHGYGNVIDQNYVGVGFDDPDTNGNIVENNVVTRNANKNIRNLSDAGTGNVARNNCGYGEPIPNGTIGNVSYSGNVTVSSNPYGVDPEPSADAVVSNSTCNAKLPADSPFRP